MLGGQGVIKALAAHSGGLRDFCHPLRFGDRPKRSEIYARIAVICGRVEIFRVDLRALLPAVERRTRNPGHWLSPRSSPSTMSAIIAAVSVVFAASRLLTSPARTSKGLPDLDQQNGP